MYDVKSVEKIEMSRGTVLCIESPVEAPREHKAYSDALGPRIRIDGIEYEPIGFDWKLPALPVRVGEVIGILARPIQERNQVKEFTGGPLTTATLADAEKYVYSAECTKCKYKAVVDLKAIRDKLGADFPLGEVRPHLKCSRCQAKEVITCVLPVGSFVLIR